MTFESVIETRPDFADGGRSHFGARTFAFNAFRTNSTGAADSQEPLSTTMPLAFPTNHSKPQVAINLALPTVVVRLRDSDLALRGARGIGRREALYLRFHDADRRRWCQRGGTAIDAPCVAVPRRNIGRYAPIRRASSQIGAHGALTSGTDGLKVKGIGRWVIQFRSACASHRFARWRRVLILSTPGTSSHTSRVASDHSARRS